MLRTEGEREYNDLVKMVRLSNFDRISGTPTDFTLDLSNDINLNRCKNIWVDKFVCPNKFNNITSNNNTLYVYAVRAAPPGNILILVNVDPGQYTVSQLMTTLQNLINPYLVATFGAGSSIALTLNPITNKIEYTVTNFDTIQFLYNNINPSTIAYSLGYTSDLAPAASGSLPFIPSLGGPQMIFLHSQQINLASTTLSINRPVSSFCSIPVTVNYLDTIVYQSLGSTIDYINLRGIRNICNVNIKLRAQDGTVLTLGDNDEIIIVLKVYYQ